MKLANVCLHWLPPDSCSAVPPPPQPLGCFAFFAHHSMPGMCRDGAGSSSLRPIFHMIQSIITPLSPIRTTWNLVGTHCMLYESLKQIAFNSHDYNLEHQRKEVSTAGGKGASPGGGVMTLHDYGYLPPEFLKSYPVSEWNFQIYTLPRSLTFLQGFFWGDLLLCKFLLLC